MKKITIYLLSVFTILLSSCDPNVDDKGMGEPIVAEDIKIELIQSSEGSNEVSLINNTPGTASLWDYVVATSAEVSPTVILPYLGDYTIKFTAIAGGGTTTVERKLTVTKLDKPAAVEWTHFAGSGKEGKVWTWDWLFKGEGAPGVYGAGGYGNNFGPSWGGTPPGAVDSEGFLIDDKETMLFDLNGGPNFTKIKADGTMEKGTFAFDMSKKKIRSDGKVWSEGEISFSGATILSPYQRWSGKTVVYTFDIIKLDEDEMILAYPQPGVPFEAWETATFWVFRAK